MKREVHVTLRANLDLTRLVDFLIERDARAAERAGEIIGNALLSLGELSERGRPAGRSRRELVVPFGRRAYVIQYYVRPGTVVVARIFHSLEDRSKA